ncbi:MAG TPA: hypothetical protein PKY82_07875, partial [Pyrinomonadaceae bacterium]|nr:hypothetical protein [Pyrinomonadaceae bacterium]
SALTSANPTTILTATSPKTLENPLFVEFRKIAIVSLKNPNNFQTDQFENSIIEALKNRVTVAEAKFIWETENGLRKLKIPMLGWEIGYQLKDNKIFVANSFEFLNEFVSTENKTESSADNFSDLTVIRLANRQENFDDVMKKISVNENDFFTGNISSFLDVIKDVRQIEIRRKSDNNFLEEEILVK